MSQKTPPLGSPIVPQQQPAHPQMPAIPKVIVSSSLAQSPPLPGMPPHHPAQRPTPRTIAVPATPTSQAPQPTLAPAIPPGSANMGGGGKMPFIPSQFQPGSTAQIHVPPQQAQQWNGGSPQQQEEAPPNKWGKTVAIVATVATVALLLIVFAIKSGGSSNSEKMGTKVPKVGQGSGSVAGKPVEEPAPPQAAPTPPAEEAPAPAAAPPQEEEEVEATDEVQCPPADCSAQNEEPAPEPAPTLEGVADDLKKFKKSQHGQWTAIGKLNKQMKEVKADIAAIRLDVNDIKKLDAMKTSDLPGMPAENVEKVAVPTIKIRTVEYDGPPPANPRPAKVRRK